MTMQENPKYLSPSADQKPKNAEEDREMFIMEGLKDEGLIDATDPSRAAESYSIIAQGYDLNRKHWDRQLGINDGTV